MGDDAKEVTRNLVTPNCHHFIKWDSFNTRISNTANDFGCVWGVSEVSKKLWSIISVYHRDSRMLFHFMRKKRHQALLKDWANGKNKFHYIYAYIQMLNSGLEAIHEQLTIFDIHTDSDDIEKWQSKTDSMLADLGLTKDDIGMEAIIHFDEKNGVLSSAGCVVYNENQGVVFEESWTELIIPVESLIQDSSEEYSSNSNHPDYGLTLASAALKRAENKHFNSEDVKDDELIKDNNMNA
ncbi:MAG: DUF5986 family protein [Defluviitaleaceae bacterium]|nr:DUF5986 family protein [Defluviitaleaceae bacterium]